MTLSSIATILVEDYLPDAYQKYIFQNFQQSPHYRCYSDNIPTYLQGCPRNVILHCLDRKGSSNKFTSEDIQDLDSQQGIFSVHSSKDKVYTVNFGGTCKDNMPNCTCADWRTHHIPCKHFFAVFQHRILWSWNKLPKEYLQSAYMSTDNSVLLSHDFPVDEDMPDGEPTLDLIPKNVC